MIPAIQWSKAIRWSQAIWWSPAIRWSIGSMDFDNPKIYGDTFISDGLVFLRLIWWVTQSIQYRWSSVTMAIDYQSNCNSFKWPSSFLPQYCSIKFHHLCAFPIEILRIGISLVFSPPTGSFYVWFIMAISPGVRRGGSGTPERQPISYLGFQS